MLPIAGDAAAAVVVIPFVTESILLQKRLDTSVDSLSGLTVDLFDRSGLSGTGRLSSGNTSGSGSGCTMWPVMTLESGRKPWLIGFRENVATALPLDSLEGMKPADSLRLTMELARLASALPEANDTLFQGLPFAVRKAYRSILDSLLIGDIVRKINEEANPREEHVLLIAERGSGGRYSTSFVTRSAGSEDVVRTAEVLSAIRFVNDGDMAVFVSFEYADGSRVALIDRTRGKWKLSWKSAYAGC